MNRFTMAVRTCHLAVCLTLCAGAAAGQDGPALPFPRETGALEGTPTIKVEVAEDSYVEHLDMGSHSVTYWGELRIALKK